MCSSDLTAKTKIELPMWLVGAVTRENQKLINGRPGNGLPLFDTKVPKASPWWWVVVVGGGWWVSGGG